MKWVIVTCDASKHIRPVQEWLFRKYAPSADLHYLDVGSEPVETWGANVLKRLPKDSFIVFGLDDYLPTDEFDNQLWSRARKIMMNPFKEKGFYFQRFELGYGACRKEGFKKTIFPDGSAICEYGPETPYSVSCQFSIWRIEALRGVLSESTTPWNFEVKHKVKAICFNVPVMRWIEESALSGKKWAGKINVNGLKAEDVNELIKLGLLDESKLINRTV